MLADDKRLLGKRQTNGFITHGIESDMTFMFLFPSRAIAVALVNAAQSGFGSLQKNKKLRKPPILYETASKSAQHFSGRRYYLGQETNQICFPHQREILFVSCKVICSINILEETVQNKIWCKITEDCIRELFLNSYLKLVWYYIGSKFPNRGVSRFG